MFKIRRKKKEVPQELVELKKTVEGKTSKPMVEFILVGRVSIPVAGLIEGTVEVSKPSYRVETLELARFTFDEMFLLAQGQNPIPDKFKEALKSLFG